MHDELCTRLDQAKVDNMTIKALPLVPADVKKAIDNTVKILEILVELERRRG